MPIPVDTPPDTITPTPPIPAGALAEWVLVPQPDYPQAGPEIAVRFSTGTVLHTASTCVGVADGVGNDGQAIGVGCDSYEKTRHLTREERYELARLVCRDWATWAHAGGRS